MITIEALQAAQPLAERLKTNGLSIQPKRGSPLDFIVGANRQYHAESKHLNGDNINGLVDVYGMMEAVNTNNPFNNVNEHTEAMDMVVQNVIKGVRGVIRLARTDAREKVNDIIDKLEQHVNGITASKLMGMEIETARMPEPMLDNTLRQLAEGYEELDYRVPYFTVNVPNVSSADIKTMLLSGSSSLDKKLSDWAALKGDEFLNDVWTMVFECNEEGTPRLAYGDFLSYLGCPVEGIDRSLLIYFIAGYLHQNVPEGVVATLNKFQEHMGILRDSAGKSLYVQLTRYDRELEKKTMVLRIEGGSKVVVMEPLYEEFLEQGGSNEILFGLAMRSRYIYDLPSILEEAPALASEWRSHSNRLQTLEANRRHLLMKEALLNIFWHKLTEEVKATGINRDKEYRLLTKEVNHLTELELRDIYLVVVRLVCHVWYAGTDVEKVLLTIHRVGVDNQHLSAQEKAALGIAAYVDEWIASMFQVVELTSGQIRRI